MSSTDGPKDRSQELSSKDKKALALGLETLSSLAEKGGNDDKAADLAAKAAELREQAE